MHSCKQNVVHCNLMQIKPAYVPNTWSWVQLTSITKELCLLSTTSYNVDAWSLGTNWVIMNIHKKGIINKGSSHKSVIVITLIYHIITYSWHKIHHAWPVMWVSTDPHAVTYQKRGTSERYDFNQIWRIYFGNQVPGLSNHPWYPTHHGITLVNC